MLVSTEDLSPSLLAIRSPLRPPRPFVSPRSSLEPSTESRVGALAAFGFRKSLAKDFRGAGCFDLNELGPEFVPTPVPESGSATVCLRISFSLAMTPRRRRNGMMDSGRKRWRRGVYLSLSKRRTGSSSAGGRCVKYYNHGHPWYSSDHSLPDTSLGDSFGRGQVGNECSVRLRFALGGPVAKWVLDAERDKQTRKGSVGLSQ